MAKKSCLVKGVLISDSIDEMPQNAGSGAKRVQKCAAILLDMVSTISAWFPVHAGVRMSIILPVPNG